MFFMSAAIALAAGMMLFEPFARPPISRFTTPRLRRSVAARSFLQAGAALFTALLVATSPPAPDRISPPFAMSVAVLLTLASVYWLLRGRRILKERRVFNHRY
jgi:hypothetical protein